MMVMVAVVRVVVLLVVGGIGVDGSVGGVPFLERRITKVV